MSGEGQDSIPKFSSFKPRRSTANANENTAKSKRNGVQQEHVKRSHREEDPQDDRDHRHKGRRPGRGTYARSVATSTDDRAARPDRHRERNRSKDGPQQRRRILSSPSSQGDRSQTSDLYIIDIKGDPSNLHYRRPNKWAVPLYHLYGSGSILGHHSDVKIDRALSDEHGYTLRYPTKSRSSMFNAPAKVDITTAKLAHDRANIIQREDGHSDQADFLPMSEHIQSKKEMRGTPIVTPKV